MTRYDQQWAQTTRDDLLINTTERSRTFIPFVFTGGYGIFYWISADKVSSDAAIFAFLFVIIGIALAVEILSCKILLFKAELREVMRTLGEYPIPAD